MNGGTFPGLVRAGAVREPLPMLGEAVLLPSYLPDTFTHRGATFLRTGAWVRAVDTALAGTVFETVDGQSSPASLLATSNLRGGRQTAAADGFYADANGDTLRLSQVLGGVQTGLVASQTIPGISTLNGISPWGWRLGSRRFVTVHDNSGAPFSRIYEYDGTVLTQRFEAASSGEFSTRPRGAANDGDTGLLISAPGNLFRTTDGGTSWAAVTPPAGLTRLHAKPGLFAAGRDSAGNVYTSPTGASGSWTTRTLPASTPVYDVLFTPSGALLAVGGNGVIYRSTDDGANWTAVHTRANTALFGFDPFNGRLIAGVSETSGPLLVSSDDGQTWGEAASGFFQNFGVTGYQFYLVQRLETVTVTGAIGGQNRLIRGAVGNGSGVTAAGSSASAIMHYFLRIA